jgi:O-antigen biosynthesis protein
LSRISSPFSKQNELIRALQKQLEAKERELADEKWIFQQFLQSPSWRLTYPVRWVAKQWRTFKAWLLGGGVPVQPRSSGPDPGDGTQASLPDNESAVLQQEGLGLKALFTEFQRVQLQALIASDSKLRLPYNDRPDISVLMVLFNRAELTLACLRSLCENRTERLEIIIVDNASTDDTPKLLDHLEGAHIIRNRENRNFLLAVNQAAAQAHGENLLILNNDTQLLPGCLGAALITLRSDPAIGAVGGRLILLDGSLQEAGSIIWRDGSCLGYGRGDDPFAPMYMFRRDVDYCSGAFLLTPRETWERLGGFDEIFKPAYYEETDYCTRLWEQGLRVVYEPRAALLHYEFASSDTIKSATDLQRDHQRIFEARHRALLNDHYACDPDSILAARMKKPHGKRVLFIDDRVPHPWLGSGFPRAHAMLLALVKQGHFVTFYPLAVPDGDWATIYTDMPAEVEFITAHEPAYLEMFLRNRRGYYDAIIVSRPPNMSIFRNVLSAYPEWFESVALIYDAEALFVSRDISLRELKGDPMPAEEAAQLIRKEVELAAEADCIVAVSEADKAVFQRYGMEVVHVLGHSLPARPTPQMFHERQGLLFIGAIHEETSPNADSLIWFLQEIYPRIRAELGDVTFTIAGVNKSDYIRQLAGPTVRITGHLSDLTGLYDSARVFVAPTRFAAGIPHKVHEAAARGVPVVVTPILSSQLGWADGSGVTVAGDALSFARRCVDLYTDAELWKQLREAALERIRTECSQEAFERRLGEIVTSTERRKLKPATASM